MIINYPLLLDGGLSNELERPAGAKLPKNTETHKNNGNAGARFQPRAAYRSGSNPTQNNREALVFAPNPARGHHPIGIRLDKFL